MFILTRPSVTPCWCAACCDMLCVEPIVGVLECCGVAMHVASKNYVAALAQTSWVITNQFLFRDEAGSTPARLQLGANLQSKCGRGTGGNKAERLPQADAGMLESLIRD